MWIDFFFFFFFNISNKNIYICQKKESPKYTRNILGWNNQFQELRKSNKSTIEKKERFLMAVSQSNKVRKKNNLRLGIECSVFSKLLLFLQWGIIIQMWSFRWRSNWPYQQARSSTTNFGITQKTSQTNQKSWTTNLKWWGNVAKGGQQIHHYICTYNTNLWSLPFFSLNCQ